ncbi:hypothetical protein BH11BAC1_BH11BAC1_13590 [soil metagenome]
MKKTFAIITLISAFAVTGATSQTPITAQAQWAEKNEFHKVMAQTFHPSEEGNYEPIRSRIGEMYDKAVAWMNSTPPKEFDKPEVKSTLKEMTGEIIAIKAMIENKATNEELKPKMEALHETFHKIVGMCAKDDHAEESHEGHNHGDQPEAPVKEHKE